MSKKTKRDIAPIHPGEILKEEFMAPLGLSVNALSRALGVPRTRLNDVVLRRRGITADTAMRLARYFRVGPEFWMNLQSHYEIECAETAYGRRLDREIKPHGVAAE